MRASVPLSRPVPTSLITSPEPWNPAPTRRVSRPACPSRAGQAETTRRMN
jgi:hypothetical protein